MEGREPLKAELPTGQVVSQRLALIREAASAIRSSAKGRARRLFGQALAHEPGIVSPLVALGHLSTPGDCREITKELLVLIGRLDRQLRGSFGDADPCEIGTAPDRLEYLTSKLEAIAVGKPEARPKRRRRSPAPGRLTAKQTEAAQVVSECEGNFAKAAQRLGIDRKTVKQHHEAAMAKLGKAAMPKAKTSSLRTDRRGQADISASDDRRT